VFGCINALEDTRGCGFGSHCSDCTLLEAIEDNFESGTGHQNIEYSTTILRNSESMVVYMLGSTAIIINELITNSIKHAFKTVPEPRISLTATNYEKMVNTVRLWMVLILHLHFQAPLIPYVFQHDAKHSSLNMSVKWHPTIT